MAEPAGRDKQLSPAEQALREAALDYHRQPVRGKISIAPTKPLSNQRDLSLAYSPGVAYACLAIADDPALRRRVHQPLQPGGRGHQRHRGAGAGRHRPAGRQAGDGRQGLPVQEVRRHRRVRHRTGREGPRQAGRHRRRARAHARRHQPRGHQGAGVLHDRAQAARAHEHPGVPRRPARHRDHQRRGAAQRPRTGGQGHRRRQDRGVGRRRGGDRLPRRVRRPRRQARAHLHRRQQGRGARRPRRLRAPGREQAALLPEDRGAHAGRRGEGRRRVPGLQRRRRAHAPRW